MWMLSKVPEPVEVTGPEVEPLTLTEAKKHLEIGSSDTAHDTQLVGLIEAARLKWEHDTQEYLIKRTHRLRLDRFAQFQFPHRPVSAITSITYYDTGNTSQTLASSVYSLDSDRSQLHLAYLQDWPSTCDRWDAVTITYVLGSHDDGSTVPQIAKAAMKLLIGYWFENRDMHANELIYNRKAYEQLVANYMRRSYP